MPQNRWAHFDGWQCWLGLREYTDEHFNQKQGDNRWVAGPWENHQVFKLTSTHNRTQISFQRKKEFWQYNTMITVVDLAPKETFQLISTGCFIWLVLPQKVLSMDLVPPNRKKWLSSLEMAKIPPKKVKVHVRVCQTFTFCCKLAGSDLDFHFFSRYFCHLQWT